MTVANTLAYYNIATIIVVKGFTVQAPWFRTTNVVISSVPW